MDVENTWILCKNCRQLGLLTLNSFIGQFVNPVSGMGLREKLLFSPAACFTLFREHDNLV